MKKEIIRDDSPAEYNLSRRKVLLGGLILLGSSYLGPSLPAWADTLKDETAIDQFMQLSKLLVNHQLDPVTGQRLAAAMISGNMITRQQIASLLAVAHARQAKVVEDFFADIPRGALKNAALSIISAGYKGVLIDAPGAGVFAYEKDLMYQPTIDVMTIPTYAITGPTGGNLHSAQWAQMPDC